MKRQEGSAGFVFPKRQNINNVKCQAVETSNNQNVKPSTDAFPIDIEKLREELYAFAEAVIQNKLDELIQNINMPTPQNVNTGLDLFSDKQAAILELPDDENNGDINIENETSAKEQIVNPSNPNRKILKTETIIPAVLIEEKVYTPITCKWINELYERFNERGNDEKFNSPAIIFKDKINQVQWVSIHYRCLLESVITVSEMKVVEWADLAELTNAFTFLIATIYFKELPDNYPYSKDIISLRDKLKYFCLETKEEEYVQFSLKLDTKKELFLQRFELSLAFPKINFNQLTLDFNIENNKQISNLKEDRRIKQSLEEKPWQKKFRESKLNG